MRTELQKNVNIGVVFEKVLQLDDIFVIKFFLKCDFELKFLFSVKGLKRLLAYYLASVDFLLGAYLDYLETTSEAPLTQKLRLDVLLVRQRVYNHCTVTFLYFYFSRRMSRLLC